MDGMTSNNINEAQARWINSTLDMVRAGFEPGADETMRHSAAQACKLILSLLTSAPAQPMAPPAPEVPPYQPRLPSVGEYLMHLFTNAEEQTRVFGPAGPVIVPRMMPTIRDLFAARPMPSYR